MQLPRHCQTDISIIGDKTTNSQVVMLLAFIRDAIKNSKPIDISLSIGKHVKDQYFDMQVNEQEIPQIIATDKTHFEIN